MNQPGTKSFILGNLFVFLLFLLSFTNARAQWAYTYGGTVNDYAHTVQQTSDGGFIMAGSTTSFGPSGNNAWIIKLDEDGIPAWQKAYGGTEDEYMSSIMQTADGGYIASGYTLPLVPGDRMCGS